MSCCVVCASLAPSSLTPPVDGEHDVWFRSERGLRIWIRWLPLQEGLSPVEMARSMFPVFDFERHEVLAYTTGNPHQVSLGVALNTIPLRNCTIATIGLKPPFQVCAHGEYSTHVSWDDLVEGRPDIDGLDQLRRYEFDEVHVFDNDVGQGLTLRAVPSTSGIELLDGDQRHTIAKLVVSGPTETLARYQLETGSRIRKWVLDGEVVFNLQLRERPYRWATLSGEEVEALTELVRSHVVSERWEGSLPQSEP